MLRLLRQRNSLSGEIGQSKRRHGAEIYVPDRERELLARVAKLAEGELPTRAVTAIYREIMSSSRAAQGQPPIGLLDRSADELEARARCHFGACDDFVAVRDWRELSRRLRAGKLAVGLLTFEDLAGALRDPYAGGLAVLADFSDTAGHRGLRQDVFVVKPAWPAPTGNRALILIECKPTLNAVKSRASAMSRVPKVIHFTPLPGRGKSLTLAAMTFRQPVTGNDLVAEGKPLGLVLGIYTVGDAHGG